MEKFNNYGNNFLKIDFFDYQSLQTEMFNLKFLKIDFENLLKEAKKLKVVGLDEVENTQHLQTPFNTMIETAKLIDS